MPYLFFGLRESDARARVCIWNDSQEKRQLGESMRNRERESVYVAAAAAALNELRICYGCVFFVYSPSECDSQSRSYRLRLFGVAYCVLFYNFNKNSHSLALFPRRSIHFRRVRSRFGKHLRINFIGCAIGATFLLCEWNRLPLLDALI